MKTYCRQRVNIHAQRTWVCVTPGKGYTMASEEIRNPNIEILNKSQTQNSNVQNFLHAGFTRILHERIYFVGSDSTVITQRLDKNLLNFGFWSLGLVSDLVLRISNFLHGRGRHSHLTLTRPRGPGFQISTKTIISVYISAVSF
jgi:hypothetical protein